MSVSPIIINPPETNYRKPNYVKYSGYSAVALGLGSVVAAKNKNLRLHKQLALLSGIASLLHIGLVEWRHFKK